jgi:hypothetical protein
MPWVCSFKQLLGEKKNRLFACLVLQCLDGDLKDQNGVIIFSSEHQEQLASATRPLPILTWPH